MKAAPVHRALAKSSRFDHVIVHTGQHYDENMSQVFLDEFGLPKPDYDLKVGSGTHAQQTGRVMIDLEPLLHELEPGYLLVYGDVNSTIAAALTGVKLGITVGHVEAGLRSFDRTMPEEINRVLTDSISDLLFAPSPDAVTNLRNEGVVPERVFLVGNVMIDTLSTLRASAAHSSILEKLKLSNTDYILVTLHRPSNVDNREVMMRSVEMLERASDLGLVVFPAHPRTRERLARFGLLDRLEHLPLRLVEPLGYIDFLRLMEEAKVVVTDSGGVQEETTVLGIPCITLRTSTERPITITEGTNRLVGEDLGAAIEAIRDALNSSKTPREIELWDGHAAERIVQVLESRRA